MMRALGATRGLVRLLTMTLIVGAANYIAPTRGQTVTAPSESGRQVAAQLGRTTGPERYRILYDLKSAGRLATGLTVADLNSIIVGMEDQRVRVINLMRRDLVPNLTAADVVALSGRTTGSSRYAILYDLKSANRIATGLTVADLNSIIAGMEDQRVRVINLMRRDLVPNLTATDVVALSGQTTGRDRYAILYDLKSANRITTGMTVADLNTIIAGMEDQRVKVVNLMKRHLAPNLSAADAVAAAGTAGAAPVPEKLDPASLFYQRLRAGNVPTWKTLGDVGSLLKGVTGYDKIADPLLRNRLRQKAGGNWVYSAVVEAFIDIVVDELERNGAFGPACPFGAFCDRYVLKSYLLTLKNMTLLGIPEQIWDQGWLIAESWQETKRAFDALPCFNSLPAKDQAELKDLYRIKKLIGSRDPPGCQGSW